MIYLIPRGTPIEIARYGNSRRPHIAKRDLLFSAPLRANGDELVFHDGYWQIAVPQSMVMERPQPDIDTAAEENCQTAI
jgi:hypothetical protein